MSAKASDIRIVPPVVEFKDCDVGTLLKRTVRVVNFGKVSRDVRFTSKPMKVNNELRKGYVVINLHI